jgi:hypothetical protein
MLLAVEDEAGARLEDERGLPKQTGVLVDLRPPPARHQHDLDVGAQTGLHRADAVERHLTLAVVQQRGASAEQRAVEI